jgi:hypothetical protein
LLGLLGGTGYRQTAEYLLPEQISALEALAWEYYVPPERCGLPDWSDCEVTVEYSDGSESRAQTVGDANACQAGWRITEDSFGAFVRTTTACRPFDDGGACPSMEGPGQSAQDPFPVVPHDGCLHRADGWFALTTSEQETVTLSVEQCGGPVQMTLFDQRTLRSDGGLSSADGGVSGPDAGAIADGGYAVLATSTPTATGDTCATLTYTFAGAGTYLVEVVGYGRLRVE